MRILVCVLVSAAGLWAQTLRIEGDIPKPVTFTATDLQAMPRGEIQIGPEDEGSHFEGVWLLEVLRRAGVPTGVLLEGKKLTTYLLATAADGYQILYSLAELAPEFGDNGMLLADTLNGAPLSKEEGPFRIVPAREKSFARSERMVVRIQVVQVVQ